MLRRHGYGGGRGRDVCDMLSIAGPPVECHSYRRGVRRDRHPLLIGVRPAAAAAAHRQGVMNWRVGRGQHDIARRHGYDGAGRNDVFDVLRVAGPPVESHSDRRRIRRNRDPLLIGVGSAASAANDHQDIRAVFISRREGNVPGRHGYDGVRGRDVVDILRVAGPLVESQSCRRIIGRDRYYLLVGVRSAAAAAVDR